MKLILNTLGNAIIQLYDENKDSEGNSIYDGGGSGFFSKGSKFAQVIDSNMKLANLITKIAKAVKDYANLTVIDYTVKNNELVPKEVHHLETKHFKDANRNIQLVLTTLGKPIEDIARDPKKFEIFESTEGIFGIGKKKSKYTQVIEGNIKLAELITKIGKGIKDFANLKMPLYDAKGEISGYKNMGTEEFTAASESIEKIITVIGGALISTYESHTDWFEDGEDSIFSHICTSVGTMGSMISNISNGIKDYADLKIPEFNKDGSIKGYKDITELDFTNAANNISKVISIIGSSIVAIYHGKRLVYKDSQMTFEDLPQLGLTGFSWKTIFQNTDDQDSPFTMITNSLASMGSMVSSISQSIKDYAELKIATHWNKNGEPDMYKKLTEDDIKEASKNISMILTTMAGTIMALLEGSSIEFGRDGSINLKPLPSIGNQDWKQIFESTNDSDSMFNKILDSCVAMGDMISSIGEGIKNYASHKIPVSWDAKTGKPTKYMPLADKEFTNASEQIGKIITTIGGAIIGIWNNAENKELFEYPSYYEVSGGFMGIGAKAIQRSDYEAGTPIDKIVMATSVFGTIINDIASGVAKIAAGKIINENGEEVVINDTTFSDAGTFVASAITALFNGIKGLANDPIFSSFGGIEITHTGLFGFSISKKPSNDIEKVLNASLMMGTIVASISDAIIKFSSNQVPIYDTDGKTIKEYKHLGNQDFIDAGDTIAKVITALSNSVINAGSQINVEGTQAVVNIIGAVGNTIGNLGESIKMYANMYCPNEFDLATGKVKSYTKMEKTHFTKASENIASVLTALTKGIEKALSDSSMSILFGELQQIKDDRTGKVISETRKPSKAELLIEMIAKASVPIKDLADIVLGLAGGKIVKIEYDSEGHKISEETTEGLSSVAIANGITNLQNLITAIPSAINTAYTSNPKLFDDIIDANNKKVSDNPVSRVLSSIENSIGFIDQVKEMIEEMSKVTVEDTKKIEVFTNIFAKTLENFSKIHLLLFATNATMLKENGISDWGLTMSFSEVLGLTNNENSRKLSGIWSFTKDESPLSKISGSLDDYIEIVKRMLAIGMIADKMNPENYSRIGECFVNLYDSISKAKSQNVKVDQTLKDLSAQQKTLDKYVTTVNRINVDKLGKLTAFINAANQLSKNLGNVDKLTEAIAEKLSVELDRLVNELNTAKEVINAADSLQTKRHEAIKKSTEEITKLMNKELLINIKQISDTNSLSNTPEGNPTEQPDDTNKDNSGGGNSGGTPTPSVVTPPSPKSTPKSNKKSNIPNMFSTSFKIIQKDGTEWGMATIQ